MVRYYELEVVGELARQRISRTAWAGRTIMDEMEFNPGPDRYTIVSWIRELDSETAQKKRGSWSRLGWFGSAASWMKRNVIGPDDPTQAIPGQHWSLGGQAGGLGLPLTQWNRHYDGQHAGDDDTRFVSR